MSNYSTYAEILLFSQNICVATIFTTGRLNGGQNTYSNVLH